MNAASKRMLAVVRKDIAYVNSIEPNRLTLEAHKGWGGSGGWIIWDAKTGEEDIGPLVEIYQICHDIAIQVERTTYQTK
jgi:hypothetical protein